jgi:hypothetical protein
MIFIWVTRIRPARLKRAGDFKGISRVFLIVIKLHLNYSTLLGCGRKKTDPGMGSVRKKKASAPGSSGLGGFGGLVGGLGGAGLGGLLATAAAATAFTGVAEGGDGENRREEEDLHDG